MKIKNFLNTTIINLLIMNIFAMSASICPLRAEAAYDYPSSTLSPQLNLQTIDFPEIFKTAKQHDKFAEILKNNRGISDLKIIVWGAALTAIGLAALPVIEHVPAIKTKKIEQAALQMHKNIAQLTEIITNEQSRMHFLRNPSKQQKENALNYINVLQTINSFDWEKQRDTIISKTGTDLSRDDEEGGLIAWLALQGIDFTKLIKEGSENIPLKPFAHNGEQQEIPEDFCGIIFDDSGNIIIAGKTFTDSQGETRKFILSYEKIEEKDRTGAGALVGLAVGGWNWGFEGAIIGTGVGYMGGALISKNGKELYKAENTPTQGFFRFYEYGSMISLETLNSIYASTYEPSPNALSFEESIAVKNAQDFINNSDYSSMSKTKVLQERISELMKKNITFSKSPIDGRTITVNPQAVSIDAKSSLSPMVQLSDNTITISQSI